MRRRLRIAMVAACPFPHARGTPVRIFRMAEALARRGHEVHVATYHLGDDVVEAPFRVHRIGRVPLYRDPSPGPNWRKLLVLDPLLGRTLSRVLRRHEIDVIHAHHVEGLLVALWAGRDRTRPILFDAHTLLESELPSYRLGLPAAAKRLAGRMLDRRLPRRASHVIAVSEDIRRHLTSRHAVPEAAITVVPNGVEWEHFAAGAAAARAGEGRPPTLVFAGNMARYQGIDLLLEAFAHVHARRRDVRLRIVTDGSFAGYEARAARLGVREAVDVVAAGFDDLPRQLAEADVALNPRVECDGLPQKLLNYMAAARPIVTFAGSAKHIRHGELGWIVPDGDTAAFGEAILHLLDQPAAAMRLGENAARYARTELGWDAIVPRLETVYERLLRHG